MKTLTITIESKKHETLFSLLAKELGVELTSTDFTPLTTKTAVLGSGKKISDEQLREYIQRTNKGTAKTASTAKRVIVNRLKQRTK